MSLRASRWIPLAAAASVATCSVVFLVYGYSPGPELADPLRAPVQLARDVIGSTRAIDRNTATLVGQHTELQRRVGALHGFATAFERLETAALPLEELASRADEGTEQAVARAGELPARIRPLRERSDQAGRDVATLTTRVRSLTAELQGVHLLLQAMLSDLEALVPRAREVANRLEEIQQDTEVLRLARPLGSRS